MAEWFGIPRRGERHHTYRDVRIQHGGRQWTGTWHVADGRLGIEGAWGSASEPIDDDADPAKRATELLQAMVEGRVGSVAAKLPGG